ncbi:MAG: YbbR-like domain-containing protein [Anaerolineae bacterium]
MKPALRWIASNLPLVLLALLLAVLAWITAAEEADPTTTDRYTQSIPVKIVGLPDDMVIVEEPNTTVQITIRAPESLWNSLRPGDFSATIDLAGLQAGIHKVPIQVTVAEEKKPLEMMLIEPSEVTLELQPWVELTVPVNIKVEGEPALAYLAQTTTVTPMMVTVSGPGPYVDRVTEAGAQLSIQDVNANVEEELSLQPLDSEGQPVSHVTMTPNVAQVQIIVELKADYRTLTIKPIREGLVAYGYTITGFFVTPESVTVSGAPADIAALPGFIETEPVSVEGAQTDVVAHPALSVPPNIALVPGQEVTVTYYVEAIQSSLTMEITPTLQNLAPGFTATVSPATVEVFLSGPLPQLEAMQPGDVRVVLELFELEAGTYQITPQVIVPNGLTDYSVLPSAVQVEILIAPTVTPTPSITPEPTPPPTATPTKD